MPKAGILLNLYNMLNLSHKGSATSAICPTYHSAIVFPVQALVCDSPLITPGGLQLSLRERHLAGTTYTRTFPRDTAL